VPLSGRRGTRRRATLQPDLALLRLDGAVVVDRGADEGGHARLLDEAAGRLVAEAAGAAARLQCRVAREVPRLRVDDRRAYRNDAVAGDGDSVVVGERAAQRPGVVPTYRQGAG